VRFTLTYDGILPSSAEAPFKQKIREVLHPQLKELWTHEPLAHHADSFLGVDTDSTKTSVLRQVGGHFFAPVVTPVLHLMAELRVEMLRPEPAGGIITNQGDLDNRLKTLFDALRVPSPQEITDGAMLSSAAEPVFTLLDDDRLVTAVSVETDRLLAPPDSSPNYTRLTISVTTKTSVVTWNNLDIS
jgi:hypothetical protein